MAASRSLRLGLGRALRRRCPQCGGASIFDGWWRMKDHCPACGHRFEREPGYWVGAVIFNTIIAIGSIFLPFGILLIFTWPEVPWTLLTIVTLASAALVPTVLYPYARTLWMAYDLYVHPLEPGEIEAARTRLWSY